MHHCTLATTLSEMNFLCWTIPCTYTHNCRRNNYWENEINCSRLSSTLYPIQSNILHKSLFTHWWSGQQSCIKHMVMCKVILLLFSPLVILFLVWLAGAGSMHGEWWQNNFFGRMCCLSGRRLFKMCSLFTLLKAIKDSVGSTARYISIYMWQSYSYHSDLGWTKQH